VEYIQSHLTMLALGLIMSLSGHDALMVTGPHPLPHEHMEHHESASRAPAPVENCGPTTGVHPQSANGLDVDDESARRSTFCMTPRLAGFIPHWSVDPDHPSATKRALLQVYLN